MEEAACTQEGVRFVRYTTHHYTPAGASRGEVPLMQKLWPRLLRINIIGILFQLSLKLGQKVALRVSPATRIRTDSFLILTSSFVLQLFSSTSPPSISCLVHSTLLSHTPSTQLPVGSFSFILPNLLHPTPASFIQLYFPTRPPLNSWLVHSTLFSHTSTQLLVGLFNFIFPHLLYPTPGWFIRLYSPTPPPRNPL